MRLPVKEYPPTNQREQERVRKKGVAPRKGHYNKNRNWYRQDRRIMKKDRAKGHGGNNDDWLEVSTGSLLNHYLSLH